MSPHANAKSKFSGMQEICHYTSFSMPLGTPLIFFFFPFTGERGNISTKFTVKEPITTVVITECDKWKYLETHSKTIQMLCTMTINKKYIIQNSNISLSTCN